MEARTGMRNEMISTIYSDLEMKLRRYFIFKISPPLQKFHFL